MWEHSVSKASTSFLIKFEKNVDSFCVTGTEFEFKNFPERIVFLNIMIFSLLVYNYYSAALTSMRMDLPIRKINDSLNELKKVDMSFASQKLIYFDFYMTVSYNFLNK